MKTRNILFVLLLTAAGLLPAAAQEEARTEEENKSGKAWEFGVGGSVFQFNRVSFSEFNKLSNGGYQFDLDLKHAVYGGNIYVARELNPHFYLDLQGFAGFAKQNMEGKDENKWLYSAGLGLQWRLGDYFGSKYVDPYLRAGAGYMRKEFDVLYTGTEGLSSDEMKWVMKNFGNKGGVDRKNLIPISLGVGVNMWFNDRWGIGLRGDYVVMPYTDVANSLEGTARIIYRLGGKSKKPREVVRYIDRPVEKEKIVEVEKIVEKRVEVEVPGKEKVLLELFNNIHFDFNKATLTAGSQQVLDEIAQIILRNPGDRFLITGFTDVRGSQEYNRGLSEQRAKAVVKALEERDVPKESLKARGVGKSIALAETSASDEVRRGDRKVTIELVNNPEYWNHLEKKGY